MPFPGGGYLGYCENRSPFLSRLFLKSKVDAQEEMNYTRVFDVSQIGTILLVDMVENQSYDITFTAKPLDL
jgi:hypothetical protein